jgi:hypothetical protein
MIMLDVTLQADRCCVFKFSTMNEITKSRRRMSAFFLCSNHASVPSEQPLSQIRHVVSYDVLCHPDR